MKTCKKCLKTADFSNFYTHKAMLDGYLNTCKNCVLQRVTIHRANNLEKIREYDRSRGTRRTNEQGRKYYKKTKKEILKTKKHGAITIQKKEKLMG